MFWSRQATSFTAAPRFAAGSSASSRCGESNPRRFRMASEQVKVQLVKHIDEAYAMEQNVLRMLDGLISTTNDAEIVRELEHHKMQTEGHAERMKSALSRHDATPSVVREVSGILGALMKMPLDPVRTEKAGRNARD